MMRDPELIKRDLKFLELEEEATLADLKIAYAKILRRYGHQKLPSYGLLRLEERKKLLQAFQKAYEALYEDLSSLEKHASPSSPSAPSSPDAPPSSPPHHQPTLQAHSPQNHSSKNLESTQYSEDNPLKENPKMKKRTPTSSQQTQLQQRLRSILETQRSSPPETPSTTPAAPLPRQLSQEERLLELQKQAVLVQEIAPNPLALELKAIREHLGLSINEIATQALLSPAKVIAIEKGDFAFFRSSKQLRSALNKYLPVLGQDPKNILNEYLNSYWNWKRS